MKGKSITVAKSIMRVILIMIAFQAVFGMIKAQQIDYVLADPQPRLMEVYGGSLLSADLDNDGDIDLVQSGLGVDLTGLSARASVFLNDGEGTFSILEQEFSDYFSTEHMVLGDVDNDGDLDLVIMSINRTDLYLNDGAANFIHDPGVIMRPADAGQIIIGDIDGDGDQDLLQYGQISGMNEFAVLYENEGAGNFSAAREIGLEPFLQAQISFIDIDGDGDLDLLSFGVDATGEAQQAVYINDGSGSLIRSMNRGILPHEANSVSLGDIDADGDMDFMVTGISALSKAATLMYINDGAGRFSTLDVSPFVDVFSSSCQIEDVDNDGDLDVLLIGSEDGGLPNIHAILYQNQGDMIFIAADTLGGEYIAASTIADLNGDTKLDIVIQGFVDDTNVYWNESLLSSNREVNESQLSIYPNPSSGRVMMEWGKGRYSLVEVYDGCGKLMYKETISDGRQRTVINISAVDGIYYVVLTSAHAQAISKLVISR